MIKTCSPNSSPEELTEFFEIMKATASFLNDNPKAKALMEEARHQKMDQDEFLKKLMAIAAQTDADAMNSP